MPIVHTLGFGQDMPEIRPLVFGELVKLARPLMEAYFSDLYHDAMWLNAQLTKPLTFYFACGESGTDIGLTEDYLNREHRYRCVVAVDDREKWTFTITGA